MQASLAILYTAVRDYLTLSSGLTHVKVRKLRYIIKHCNSLIHQAEKELMKLKDEEL